MSHLVIVDNSLGDGFVQHLFVPLLQAFGLGDLLVQRVTVKDVIVPFARRTRPDMTRSKPGTRTHKVI